MDLYYRNVLVAKEKEDGCEREKKGMCADFESVR